MFVCGLGHGEGTRFFAALRMIESGGLGMTESCLCEEHKRRSNLGGRGDYEIASLRSQWQEGEAENDNDEGLPQNDRKRRAQNDE